MATLPDLQPREWRAFIALMASIIGAVAMTGVSGWLIYIIWKGGWTPATEPERLAIMGKALILTLSGNLLVLITLGFAINRRSIKISRDGVEAEGGSDDADSDDDDDNKTSVTSTVIVKPKPTK